MATSVQKRLCTVCGKQFKSQGYRKHVMSHNITTATKSETKRCLICGKQFKLKGEPYAAKTSSRTLLWSLGWHPTDIVVLDLQTGEAGRFRAGGSAKADLNKHRIWVCPMFEPFLTWLYKQDLTDIDALPSFVNLGDVPTAFQGYRRPGKDETNEGNSTPM